MRHRIYSEQDAITDRKCFVSVKKYVNGKVVPMDIHELRKHM